MSQRSFTSNNAESKAHDSINPFLAETSIPWGKIPQVVFMSVTIAPIRFVTLAVIEICAWLLASVALYGIDKYSLTSQPLSGWRKSLKDSIYQLGKLGYWVQGFTLVEIKGKPAGNDEATALVVAPHQSFFDANVFFMANQCPTVTTKAEYLDYPLIGSLLKVTQPILVDRQMSSNTAAIEEISRRASSRGLWPQYVIFPEGTNTNGRALIPFKLGAFIPGLPVQPVTVQYTDKWNTSTWTWLGGLPGNGLIVEFHPVYQPNEEEQADHKLYAENVRKYMADALKLPCSQFTLSDAKSMVKQRDVLTKSKL